MSEREPVLFPHKHFAPDLILLCVRQAPPLSPELPQCQEIIARTTIYFFTFLRDWFFRDWVLIDYLLDDEPSRETGGEKERGK